MSDARFGIEAEYALVRPDGRFADFTNTSYAEVQRLLAPLPDYGHPELRVGDAGIRVKNWYVEGDERFDEDGRSTGLAFKGIEIRTPVSRTIDGCMASLGSLRSTLEAALSVDRWSLAAIGFNPCTASYEPDYSAWEREFHASHVENRLPEVSTLSYGPDLNFSRSDSSPEEVLAVVRRLTYYSPYIVPFSFSSPFIGSALWSGLSYRTYRRTGPRPAALAHLTGKHDHPLVKEASPPSQHLRIEFKAFDMISDDRLLNELFHLIVGISLADARDLSGAADMPDEQLHRRAAVAGFDDDMIRDGASRIVATARTALRATGCAGDFPLLSLMLATRRTPAHLMRERFEQAGILFAALSREIERG